MFTNTMFQRSAKAVRFLAVAVMVAASAPAFAQSSGGGGGGGGGGSGDGRGNAVLQCLGPDCINVSKAQVPCTSYYCPTPKLPEPKNNTSCDVRVCKLENGRRNCRIEVSYDERICIKHQYL